MTVTSPASTAAASATPATRPPLNLAVYLVTDSGSMLPEGKSVEDQVKAALEGGATLIQLREKSLDTGAFITRARALLTLCRAYNVPLLINDRIDVALAVDADGVHLGQDDMDPKLARAILGPNKYLGVTVHNMHDAERAADAGADYLGTCAIFDTQTKKHKPGFEPLGVEGVKAMLTKLAEHHKTRALPVCTIGGLHASNVGAVLKDTATKTKKLDGVAVVSAIMAQKDARAATAQLKDVVERELALAPVYATREACQVVSVAAETLRKLREGKASPLVHHITNFVVMNDNANAALAVGGSPVMAHAENEMEAMTGIASSLVLNVGTLSDTWISAMLTAGRVANARGIPVVLDPVGAGATPYRLATCRTLLSEIKFDIIKGNAGEIAALANVQGVEQRGVDSGEVAGGEKASVALAVALAKATGAVVAMSGATDYVARVTAEGKTQVVAVDNGTQWLGKITGTGCTTATLVGCFAGVLGKANAFEAAVAGILTMCVAGEKAVALAKGPMSFKVALFDEFFNVMPADLVQAAKVRDRIQANAD
ncbi:Hydroxyethylthiazole kinase family-domain-containing protein [Catenaria anguillulae PL171]|uniref:Hydroxyethylthiazole kinase family-domain-containing protein n=1 Tax=Catenaria anguillulae PL171 TaxID=765915 RepID=A0A1Y2HIG7_9FUNG|nr:Hydroxyethylthiazole kinase family-domain-containing protein [Catenaria anguillulae PL171]